MPKAAVHSKERNVDAAAPELLVTSRAVNLFESFGGAFGGFFLFGFFCFFLVCEQEESDQSVSKCIFGKFHLSPHKLHYFNNPTLKILYIFILLTSAVDSSKANIF